MTSGEHARIRGHYRAVWGGTYLGWRRPDGPMIGLDPDFSVVARMPDERRALSTYATVGMSAHATAPLELHLFSRARDDSLVELLTMVAHYHRTGAPLGLGHTVALGRPWTEGARAEHGYVSLPYLDGPELERQGERRYLWLIPITADERDFKKAHGIDALEALFEARSLEYADPRRPSVVKGAASQTRGQRS